MAECRHGFHPGRCLAPACENAERVPAAPRPALRRAVREVTQTRREVREVAEARREVRDVAVSLSEAEAREVRRLILEYGADRAARQLGLDARTARKAGCREPVSALTAAVVRAALAKGRG